MDLIKRFKKYLEAQKLSEISINNYLADVNKFLQWQLGEKQTITFSQTQFQDYNHYLLKAITPLSTIKRYICSLRQFGRFLEEENLVPKNPVENWQWQSISQTRMTANGKNSKKMLDSFGKFLKKENLAPATIINYLADVRQFLRWLEKKDDH